MCVYVCVCRFSMCLMYVYELLKAVLSCAVDVWQCVCISTQYTSITIHSHNREETHCVCVVLVIIKKHAGIFGELKYF